MTPNARNIAVGLTVIVALAMLGGMILIFAGLPQMFQAGYEIKIINGSANSMQFYPEASLPEAVIHPGVYQRRNGMVDLSTIQTPGFGYGLEKINRELPEPVVSFK